MPEFSFLLRKFSHECHIAACKYVLLKCLKETCLGGWSRSQWLMWPCVTSLVRLIADRDLHIYPHHHAKRINIPVHRGTCSTPQSRFNDTLDSGHWEMGYNIVLFASGYIIRQNIYGDKEQLLMECTIYATAKKEQDSRLVPIEMLIS